MKKEQPVYAVIGINGAGSISDIYLQNMIRRFPALRVKAICSRQLAKAQTKAAEYGIEAVTWEEMLKDPAITMIVNLTPADAHYQIIKAALLAGKHVFTEKVLTETFAQGQEVCSLAKERGLYLGSAPETFLGSAGQTARKALDEGRIGEVTSFHVEANRDLGFMTGMFRALCVPGGGIGMDYGVYYMTSVFNLLGPAARVCGIIKNPQHVRRNIVPGHPLFGEEYTIADETQLFGVAELANGICGTIHLNGESITQDEGGITLFGTKGHLHLPCANFMGGPVTLVPRHDAWDQKAEPILLENGFYFEDNARGIGAADLAKAIHDGGRSRVSCELPLHVLEFFEGLYVSSRENRWVELTTTCERPAPMPGRKQLPKEEDCFV